MKTISQYKEDIKALMAKSADIDAQCVAETREPRSDELALKNEILDKVQELQGIVKTLERQENLQNALTKPQEPLTVPKDAKIEVKDRKQDRFSSLGEQLACIMRAGTPGGSVDPRLLNAASGLGESVSSDGGFLVRAAWGC